MHGEFHTETEPEFEPPPRRHPAMRWLRWVVARNPLYPLSAALLLFGINRLSIDPTFLPTEEANLFFNFSALELYELMLVGVALLLAHRRIHYDATLLTIIENGLVFVPFILVTQAVLIDRDIAAFLCGAAVVLAGVRFALLRRTRVLLPPRLLLLGAGVLLFNLIVPFIYRSRMELDATDWLLPGRLCWLFVLPAIVVLANAFETPERWSDEPHRQTWLPLSVNGLMGFRNRNPLALHRLHQRFAVPHRIARTSTVGGRVDKLLTLRRLHVISRATRARRAADHHGRSASARY